MADLRNSYNVRYVFGVVTTYEQWQIYWFDDTDQYAEERVTTLLDKIAHTIFASERYIEHKVNLRCSKIYKRTDFELVEVLCSLLYKMSMTPISTPSLFIQQDKKYVHVTSDKLSFRSLPRKTLVFSYKFPNAKVKNFFLLQYYHRGGDGRIALGCSEQGELCVLKFVESDGHVHYSQIVEFSR